MSRVVEPGDLFSTVLELLEAGRPFAVATVLVADHSTPVKAGARAVIEADGRIHGTVGGGVVEAEAQQRARLAARSGKAVVFEVDLRGPGVESATPICGGAMRLLVEASAAASVAEHRRALAALARRDRGVWLTMLRHGPHLEVTSRYVEEERLAAENGLVSAEALRACLGREEAGLFAGPAAATGERLEVFVSPLLPKPVLVIVGGGHIGQALAAQASLVGFEIVVIEDRAEFAYAALFPPGAKTICGDVVQELGVFPVRPDTYIVLVTRGHQSDVAGLRACIGRPAAYIGMIGSRRKVPLVRRQFLEQRWATAEEFDRIHAPIGLDIGAVSVPEIAASIVAQLIAVRRKDTAP